MGFPLIFLHLLLVKIDAHSPNALGLSISHLSMEIDKLEQNEEAVTATKLLNVVSVTSMKLTRRHLYPRNSNFRAVFKLSKIILIKGERIFPLPGILDGTSFVRERGKWLRNEEPALQRVWENLMSFDKAVAINSKM